MKENIYIHTLWHAMTETMKGIAVYIGYTHTDTRTQSDMCTV